MTNSDLPPQTMSPAPVISGDTGKSAGLGILGKVLVYLFGLVLWLPIGGFLSIGPRIAHNIENAVGRLALDGTAFFWVTLPITGLIALVMPNTTSGRIFGVNVLLWIFFLAYLYVAWHNAYPRAS